MGGLLAAAISLHAGKNEEYPGESEKWRRYESPHFELYSGNDDQQSREVLYNLELLRTLFFDTVKLKERQPLALTIFYFTDRRDFIKYVDARMRGNDDLAGYHMGQPDRAVIVLSPTWDNGSARQIIFHEYIHHLVQISGEDPPLWFNEGLAELFSSLQVKSDTLEFGRPLPWCLNTLQREPLLPLATLFAVDHLSPIYNTGTHTGQFYAESWALLHFWYYGQSKLNREKIIQFLTYIRNEKENASAAERRKMFQQSLGMDYPAMEKLLDAYVQGGRYSWVKVAKPPVASPKTYESRRLDLPEIRERLAELDLRANKSGKARLALLRAAGQVPANPRVLEALGTDSWVQGEMDQAYGFWQRALDAGTENPAIFYEMGKRESDRWFGPFNFGFDYNYRMPDDLSSRLRTLLKRSIELTPDQSEAYEVLAWVEGTVAKPDVANVNLVQKKIDTLPHRGATLTALALVRLHVQDNVSAREILKEVEATKLDPAMAEVVKIIRAHVPTGSPEEGVIKSAPVLKDMPELQSVDVIDAK